MATDPFTGMVPRKMTPTELARAIRIDIASEIDATNLYQAHIDATDDERAKALLAHIRDEEKEHIAEFTQLLAILDPYEGMELREAPDNVANILAGAGASSTAAQPDVQDHSGYRTTVGSLSQQGQP
jgi:uncharacterized protein